MAASKYFLYSVLIAHNRKTCMMGISDHHFASSAVVHYLVIRINASVKMVLLDSIVIFPHHLSMVSIQCIEKPKTIQYAIVCQSMPCKNGGTCYAVDSARYVCACPPSYTDAQCSTSIGMRFST